VEERVGDFSLLQTRYLWGLRYIDDLILRERDVKDVPNGGINERRYFIADANWNVVAVCTTTVYTRFAYDAFGKLITLSDAFVPKATTTQTLPTFTGQLRDLETGLMLYRNRVYHPTLGRFVQRDPIGYNAGDVNLVRYVFNRSQMGRDAFGLQSLGDIFDDLTPNEQDFVSSLPIYTWPAVIGHGPRFPNFPEQPEVKPPLPSPVPRPNPQTNTSQTSGHPSWSHTICCVLVGLGIGTFCLEIGCICAAGEVPTLGTITIPCAWAIPTCTLGGPAAAAIICDQFCPV